MVNLNFPLTHGAQAAPFLQGLLAVQALSGRKPPELKWDYHRKHHLTSPVRSLQAIGRFISALCQNNRLIASQEATTNPFLAS